VANRPHLGEPYSNTVGFTQARWGILRRPRADRITVSKISNQDDD
jgi:hypothetical protein